MKLYDEIDVKNIKRRYFIVGLALGIALANIVVLI